jgi:hypothetical protein
LTWFPESHVGFYPVEAGAAVYNEDYWLRYRDMQSTDIGKRLTEMRVAFVSRHYEGTLVDIGIGGGAFLSTRSYTGQQTYGTDINPVACAWLRERGIYVDLNDRRNHLAAVSMWDVLEHIEDFRGLVGKVKEWVFLSLPIFRGPEHVLRSKHFRKDEHCWYFTRYGLIQAFDYLGFQLAEFNTFEQNPGGREDIESFAFRRKS